MVFVIGNRELQWFFNHIFQQILINFAMRWQSYVIQNGMIHNMNKYFPEQVSNVLNRFEKLRD